MPRNHPRGLTGLYIEHRGYDGIFSSNWLGDMSDTLGLTILDIDDCFTQIVSYGLASIERMEYTTRKGNKGTIGAINAGEQLPEVFDFNGGCLMGVFGYSEQQMIRQLGFYYSSPNYNATSNIWDYVEPVIEEPPVVSNTVIE